MHPPVLMYRKCPLFKKHATLIRVFQPTDTAAAILIQQYSLAQKLILFWWRLPTGGSLGIGCPVSHWICYSLYLLLQIGSKHTCVYHFHLPTLKYHQPPVSSEGPNSASLWESVGAFTERSCRNGPFMCDLLPLSHGLADYNECK